MPKSTLSQRLLYIGVVLSFFGLLLSILFYVTGMTANNPSPTESFYASGGPLGVARSIQELVIGVGVKLTMLILILGPLCLLGAVLIKMTKFVLQNRGDSKLQDGPISKEL